LKQSAWKNHHLLIAPDREEILYSILTAFSNIQISPSTFHRIWKRILPLFSFQKIFNSFFTLEGNVLAAKIIHVL